MQIVIDISEKMYEELKYLNVHGFTTAVEEAVANGTPLPKGHGRLIDVNDLDITTIETDDYSGNEILDVVTKEDLDEAPTIIPADTESEGEE